MEKGTSRLAKIQKILNLSSKNEAPKAPRGQFEAPWRLRGTPGEAFRAPRAPPGPPKSDPGEGPGTPLGNTWKQGTLFVAKSSKMLYLSSKISLKKNLG